MWTKLEQVPVAISIRQRLKPFINITGKIRQSIVDREALWLSFRNL